MELTSVDIIERVLGARLVPANWKARAIAEIDWSDTLCAPPTISRRQYHEIRGRLEEHWTRLAGAFACQGFLYICLRLMTRLHQFTAFNPDESVRDSARSAATWRITAKPQVAMDATEIARKALLYSEGVILWDPTELMRPEYDSNGWELNWRSVYFQLACLEKLVGHGYVTLFPEVTVQRTMQRDPSNPWSRRAKSRERAGRTVQRDPSNPWSRREQDQFDE